MIRGSTGRFLTLILAPLFVIGATALVLLPGRGDDTVKVDADGPAVRIEAPETGSRYSPGPVTIISKVTDPDGLSTAELRVEGKRVARVTLKGGSEETATFTWTPSRAGEYELAVRARDSNGAWGAPDAVAIQIETDDEALPPPPTYVTTVAPTDPATSPAPADTGVALPLPEAGQPDSPDSTLLPPLISPRTTSRTTTPGSSATTPRRAAPGTPAATAAPGTPGTPGTPATTRPAPEPATTPVPTLPPTTPPPCVVPAPSISQPREGATEVSRTPLVTWTLNAPCPAVAQELQVVSRSTDIYGRPVTPVRLQVALSGTARSYQLTRVLPPCTTVRLAVLAYDQVTFRQSRWKNITTTLVGCPPLPTTTVPTTPPTDPPTTVPTTPPTDPPTTVPTTPPTDPPTTPATVPATTAPPPT